MAQQLREPGLHELLRQAIEPSLERGGLWRDIRGAQFESRIHLTQTRAGIQQNLYRAHWPGC
ncbi:hypothetical protein [Roseateles sp.]|uniref:hypothetical protein n=1 Tax=Roseateles sp. TaxID=1971397 RepID=UPI003BA814E3